MKNNDTPIVEERTFTQEEVNRIVSERLSRAKDERSAALDERERAVQAREMAVMAAEKLAAAGLPKGLTDVLRYDSEESLDAAIKQLTAMRGFKPESETKGDKRYIDTRLPERPNDTSPDFMIANAFRVPKD